MGDRVLLASPGQLAPFAEASEIVPSGPAERRIAVSGGTELLPETAFRREVEERRSALARRR